MKEYITLCLAGESTIPERKRILDIKRNALLEQLKQVQECIDYIDWKQSFYDSMKSVEGGRVWTLAKTLQTMN